MKIYITYERTFFTEKQIKTFYKITISKKNKNSMT